MKTYITWLQNIVLTRITGEFFSQRRENSLAKIEEFRNLINIVPIDNTTQLEVVVISSTSKSSSSWSLSPINFVGSKYGSKIEKENDNHEEEKEVQCLEQNDIVLANSHQNSFHSGLNESVIQPKGFINDQNDIVFLASAEGIEGVQNFRKNTKRCCFMSIGGCL